MRLSGRTSAGVGGGGLRGLKLRKTSDHPHKNTVLWGHPELVEVTVLVSCFCSGAVQLKS